MGDERTRKLIDKYHITTIKPDAERLVVSPEHQVHPSKYFKPQNIDPSKDPDGFKRLFPSIHEHLGEDYPVKGFARTFAKLFGMQKLYRPTADEVAAEAILREGDFFDDDDNPLFTHISQVPAALIKDVRAIGDLKIQANDDMQKLIYYVSYGECLTDKVLGLTKGGLAVWKARSDHAIKGIYEDISTAEDIVYGIGAAYAFYQITQLRTQELNDETASILERLKNAGLAGFRTLAKNPWMGQNGIHLAINAALPAAALWVEEKKPFTNFHEEIANRTRSYFGESKNPILNAAGEAGTAIVKMHANEASKQIQETIGTMEKDPDSVWNTLEHVVGNYGKVIEKTIPLAIRISDSAITSVPLYTAGFARAIAFEYYRESIPGVLKDG